MTARNKIQLEIVCTNIESVVTSNENGADRIELCASLSVGGLTPSYGLIQTARKIFSTGLFVLIRPREGDFLYSDEEFEIIKRDIGICKELKADGVVVGFLNPDGTIDKKRLAEIVNLARPMSVTFHRAFDLAKDAEASMEDIISCKCDRILTSGQKQTAIDGAGLIQFLIQKAAGRIIILPGSGIRPGNVAALVKKTGAVEVHSSASGPGKSKMEFSGSPVRMGSGEGPEVIQIADPGLIRQLRLELNNFS